MFATQRRAIFSLRPAPATCLLLVYKTCPLSPSLSSFSIWAIPFTNQPPTATLTPLHLSKRTPTLFSSIPHRLKRTGFFKENNNQKKQQDTQ
jgi:hypothetical protein